MAAQSSMDVVHVVALLASAVVAVPLFKRLGLGSVLGYLAAGLVIGPFGFGLFNDAHTILHVAELGVVIFLFVIGLEMNPTHLWHLRKQIFGLGSMQVVAAAILLTFVGMLFGVSWQVAFIGASGFVLTSTAIVMSVLSERNELSGSGGQKIVSILLFEDLLIVPLLAVVAFLSPNHIENNTPLWQSIGFALISLGILVAVGRWLLNPLFRLLARYKAREVMTAAALLVVLGGGLLLEKGGLSMAMGAFLAGVLLSESNFRIQLPPSARSRCGAFPRIAAGLIFSSCRHVTGFESSSRKLDADSLWRVFADGCQSLSNLLRGAYSQKQPCRSTQAFGFDGAGRRICLCSVFRRTLTRRN